MQNVIITGGTGLIGSALSELLIAKGYKVTVLTRKSKPAANGISYSQWNPYKGEIDRDLIANGDYIVHLAGEGVADKRWTAKRKKEIQESRTKSGELLVATLKDVPNNIRTVVSSSAIGWYGPDLKGVKGRGFTEESESSEDFLGNTCKLWEESIKGVETDSRRLVIMRTGIVLSPEGGALKEFIKPIKFGVAAILGSGEQVISWIHLEDLCRLYLMAIEDNSMRGIYNAVSPSPVTNSELNQKLAVKLKGKFFLPVHVPSFALKLGLGEMSVEVLKSATVSSEKIQQKGFQFLYPSIDAAIGNLIK